MLETQLNIFIRLIKQATPASQNKENRYPTMDTVFTLNFFIKISAVVERLTMRIWICGESEPNKINVTFPSFDLYLFSVLLPQEFV